ncbi:MULTISPECIES: dihydrofolate reductase family protein [unclassified Brachybacterium]|uniref:dihydrofolate reductase family protein n=1 Tax=unclassified Brachybacterium TaxID=2623841 RepID=UPI004033AE24
MTRQLIVTEFLSLDGVMEAPGGGAHPHAGWTVQGLEFVPEAYAIKGSEQEEATALLLGRVSFEEFAPVWPDMDEQFAAYNRMPKHVVSTTLTREQVMGTRWENCHLLRDLDEVRELLAGEGGPVLVHGSAALVQSLAAAGLVDRYHLLTFPVVLGTGKRLFADGDAYSRLALQRSETFSNGVRLDVYDVLRDRADALSSPDAG